MIGWSLALCSCARTLQEEDPMLPSRQLGHRMVSTFPYACTPQHPLPKCSNNNCTSTPCCITSPRAAVPCRTHAHAHHKHTHCHTQLPFSPYGSLPVSDAHVEVWGYQQRAQRLQPACICLVHAECDQLARRYAAHVRRVVHRRLEQARIPGTHMPACNHAVSTLQKDVGWSHMPLKDTEPTS